jgi:hydroxymethylbilane synthase
LILGTRGSALAVAQVVLTQAALAAARPELTTEVKKFTTRGDKKLDLSLVRESEAGGKGLFTKELEDELLSGEIDVAVHSLKDLPGHLPPGLELSAVLERADTADVLLAKEPGGLDALAQGARVGTSSVRRARQLQWLRPDLQIEEWRGNVQTRLRKLAAAPEVSGIVLAQAGLDRLGYSFAGGTLEFEEHRFAVTSLHAQMLPAIGQGAIALEARSDRPEIRAILAKINHERTFTAIRAERELQRLLAGDCTLPVGVRTTLDGDRVFMRGILFGKPGEAPRQARAEGSDPEAVAAELAERLMR